MILDDPCSIGDFLSSPSLILSRENAHTLKQEMLAVLRMEWCHK
jgi:hypothetical protein